MRSASFDPGSPLAFRGLLPEFISGGPYAAGFTP